MAKIEGPKYQIGEKVLTSDGEICEVLKMSFDGSEWTYVLSSKEVDTKKRALVDGIKHSVESELKPVSDEEKE